MPSTYGWIITRDHINTGPDEKYNRVGTVGPRDISDEMEAALKAGKGHTFRMYDDDGTLYYTGRGILPADPGEECAGPLEDFGRPDAGAVEIRWHGHKEWDCG